jgi:hypothetical protein
LFALQPFYQSTLWDLLVFEEGGNRASPLGGVEFDPLVEIVNPIPAGAMESQELGEKSDRSGGLPKSRSEAK